MFSKVNIITPQMVVLGFSSEIGTTHVYVILCVQHPEFHHRNYGTEDRTTSVVVVDATYRKAKNMAKHFARRIDPSGGVAQVALQPEAASVLARAQKQYAQAAGGATDLGRISTAEAVALFLRECGEAADKVESLVECVRLDATRAAARE